jgi:hypothetical protein
MAAFHNTKDIYVALTPQTSIRDLEPCAYASVPEDKPYGR